MRNLLTLFLFSISLSLHGQKTDFISTQKISQTFEYDGTEKALTSFGFGVSPLYRIDSALALKIALACSFESPYDHQLRFLKEVGLHIHADQLTQKLLYFVSQYRIEYENSRQIHLIESDLLFGLIFQNSTSAIDPLKNEFSFWKHLGDSIAKLLTDTTNEFSVLKQSFNHCRYNFFEIGFALNKLGLADFTTEYISSLDPDIDLGKFKPLNLTNDNAKWDTLYLKNNYDSIQEVDYINEKGIINLNKYFGLLDKNCSLQLTYNGVSGILYSSCWTSERSSWMTVYELKFIGSNKFLVRWIRGGVS